MNSNWKHLDAQSLCNVYLFMNSVCLYYLCILIWEESRGISTAGVPYSLLLTFAKALSTNMGWNSISLPSHWGTACRKISDWKHWLLLTEFKAADTTIKDDSFGSQVIELVIVCMIFILYCPLPHFAHSLTSSSVVFLDFWFCMMWMWCVFSPPLFPSLNKGKRFTLCVPDPVKSAIRDHFTS